MTGIDPGTPPALLLIGCSRRKTVGLRRGCAWDIYDGPLFQVLKKALRHHDGWQSGLTVLIASAKHGILPADRVISTYDEALTASTARRQGGRFARQLRTAIAGLRFRAVHVNLGRNYLRALPDLEPLLAPATVDRASGGIGVRNAQTRRWVLEQLAAQVSDGTAGPRSRPRRSRSDSRR